MKLSHNQKQIKIVQIEENYCKEVLKGLNFLAQVKTVLKLPRFHSLKSLDILTTEEQEENLDKGKHSAEKRKVKREKRKNGKWNTR